MIRAVIFSLVVAFPGLAQSGESTEQQLLQVEDQHLLAMINHSHDILAGLYDDQFRGVLASGLSVDKTKMIEFLESGSPHILLSIEDVKASIYGAVGIVTGKVVSKSKSGSVIGRSRYIRVYQKTGDQWRIIQSQGTVIIQD
jgi:hypothetical protein